MIRIAFFAAIAALFFTTIPAFADSTHICQGNSCNGSTDPSASASAAATAISNATATGIGIGGGASVHNKNVFTPTNVNQNVNTNTFKPVNTNVGINEQSQKQKQSQSQGQGQVQGQNNEQTIAPYQGQDVKIDASTNFDRYAPSVSAPALTSAGTGVCLGSVSIGLSGPMAGASFGITKVDKGCELRSNAALLYQMGYKDAAVRLLMKNDDVRDALGAEAPGAKTAATSVEKPVTVVQETSVQPVALTVPAAMEQTQQRRIEAVQGN